MEGFQRVRLRGFNLGESKSDIIKVVIAGVDCTSTLEYISPGEVCKVMVYHVSSKSQHGEILFQSCIWCGNN